MKTRTFRALDTRREQLIWEIRALAVLSSRPTIWRMRRVRIRQRALNLINKRLARITLPTPSRKDLP